MKLAVRIFYLCVAAAVCTGCFHRKIDKLEDATERLALEPADEGALGILKQSLQDNDPYVRTMAVVAMGSLGNFQATALGPKLVPLLVEKVKDDDGSVRREAVLALGHYKSFAHIAATNLTEVLSKFPGHDVAWFAADLLGELGTNGAVAIPFLIEAIARDDLAHDAREMLRNHAAEALYKLSLYASNLSMKVGPLLKTLDSDARLYAGLAVLKSDPTDSSASEAVADVLRAGASVNVIVSLRELLTFEGISMAPSLKSAIRECSQHTNANIRRLAQQFPLTD